MSGIRRLRVALSLLCLGVFLYLTAGLLPLFLRNLRLQRYMEDLAQSAGAPEQVRAQVVEKARELGLPLEAHEVSVESLPGSVRLAARYRVGVRLPGYTVTLHFSPSAGR